MDNQQSLNQMIEDLIGGKDEDAQTHFHSYMADKMKVVFGSNEVEDKTENDDGATR